MTPPPPPHTHTHTHVHVLSSVKFTEQMGASKLLCWCTSSQNELCVPAEAFLPVMTGNDRVLPLQNAAVTTTHANCSLSALGNKFSGVPRRM